MFVNRTRVVLVWLTCGIHCWIKFGGYSTNALAGRLFDCEASILVVGGRTNGC